MQLYLSSHVYACVSGEQLVLLDVRRDEYMGLAASEARALAAYIKHWPVVPDSDSIQPPPSQERVRRLLERFVALKIVTSTPQSNRVIPGPITVVQSTLVRERPGMRPQVRPQDVIGLVRASMCATRHLRFGSLESTIDHVRVRKEHWVRAQRMGTTRFYGDDRLRHAVAAFLYLRPLVYRRKDNCLFDSLALLEYLAGRRVFPIWVLGVRVAPFAAHCWVQEGAVVFNDSPEHVRRYSPILSI